MLNRNSGSIKQYCISLLSAVAFVGCTEQSEESKANVSDDVSEAAVTTYKEKHRPQFHFSPPANWMNDPNGMVYYEGEYHLFYQYYPDDTVWGPMHWAHAVSTDLVHWEHLPIALYPDELGNIFSGSAVVDWNNVSGFGKGGKPPLIAFYTYNNPELKKLGENNHEYQALAYSNDRGRTWTKYQGNPIIPNTQGLKDFRDPKVFWHAPSEKWVMAISATNHVQLWGSTNLKDWKHLSDFGKEWNIPGVTWECPDLVQLRLTGTDQKRWVLIQNHVPGGPQGGSGTQYFIGDFDGTAFTIDPAFAERFRAEGPQWLDTGRDNYAGVNWSGVPQEDGRTLFIGWMSNWDYATKVPTEKWRSAMTLPRSLALREVNGAQHLVSEPIRELQQLRGNKVSIAPVSIDADNRAEIDGISASQSEISLTFAIPQDGHVDAGLELENELGESYRIGYNSETNRFYSDRTKSGDFSFAENFASVHESPRIATGETITMHVYLDKASAELFADNGLTVMTDTFFPSRDFSKVSVYSRAGTTTAQGEAWNLERIW